MTHLRHGVGGQGRLGLRAIAIAIAIAGLIDPALTVSRPPPQRLVAIRMTSAPSLDAEQTLRANLPGWEIEARESQSRVPCGPDEQCVMIADGSVDAIVPGDLSTPLALIAADRGASPNVSIQSVSVSSAHQAAAGVARIGLAGTGVEGKTIAIRVLDGTAVIGSATHQWSKASAATIDVPWWPIDSAARTLRIEAVAFEGEKTTIDNQIDVGVNVTTARWPVLVFDARPSWSSTFVRRAIEDDARFVVGYRTRLAPSLSAGTANGRLDAAALDLAAVVVIGDPDALTAGDLQLLDQFVRVKGGTLVLVPERAPAGPWSHMLPGKWTEHLTATPETVGPLHATEILRVDQLPITSTVMARSGSSASILVLPSGNGHVVMSGAMDAWRYRDLDAGGFDRFWRSLIAEGAALGEGRQLTFDQALAVRGSRARFTLRDRRMTRVASSRASAIARCGDAPATTIRLWPGGALGEFDGEVPLTARGSCSIEATVDDHQIVGAIAVADQPNLGVNHTLAKLARRVMAAGGVVTRAGEEARLARMLTTAPPAASVDTTVHPMRVAWWMLPFAACLSVEWWLRRRSGVR